MTEQATILDLSEQSFDAAVLGNGRGQPVLVAFIAPWSGESLTLAERLTTLAREFAGRFVFAKVNVDDQEALRARYRIEHLPTLLVFCNGRQARTEVGERHTDELRALLRSYGICRPSEELREQARARHIEGDDHNALRLLGEAIEKDPRDPRAALDMAQIYVDIGDLPRARTLFDRLPEEARQSGMGKAVGGHLLLARLASETAGVVALNGRLSADPEDLAARFDLAICEAARHQYPAAMEHLFQIMEWQPDFRNGAARNSIDMLIDILGPNMPELAREYRQRLDDLVAG